MSHTTKNILIGLLILVILFLLTCNRPIIEKPVIIHKDTIINRVIKDEAQEKKVIDSTNAVIDKLKEHNKGITEILKDARQEIKSLYENNTDLVNKVADVELKNKLLLSGGDIKRNCEIRDSVNRMYIGNLNTMLLSKDNIILAQKEFGIKLKSNLDTCLSNQAALERYAKQLQPRNELSVGLTANVNPAFGIGFIAQFRNKKGVAIQGSAMLLNGQVYNQVSVLKPISLRK